MSKSIQQEIRFDLSFLTSHISIPTFIPTSLYGELRNNYEQLFQLTDICEVTAVLTECTTNLEDKKDLKVEACDQNDPKSSDEQPKTTSEENDSNQLISFGGNAGNDEKLDGLSLDDLNGKNVTRLLLN